MEAVVIGAGHAGLAASQQLAARGVDHVVLERRRIGSSWSDLRWDSFALNTPSWMNVLPGDTEAEIAQPADGFQSHHAWVRRLEDYARRWQLPVHDGTEVTAIEAADGKAGLVIRARAGEGRDAAVESIEARSIVVASGGQNVPRIPVIAADLPATTTQMPALDYKRPGQLPDGAVLVVGAGQTGGQITEELLGAGRTAYWSVSAVTRVPRRYRGRDILEWFDDMEFWRQPTESITDPAAFTTAMPIISGVGRLGHTLSLQWLAARGARLIGRITAVDDGVLRLQDTVADCIRFGDRRSSEVKAQVDQAILGRGAELPPDEPDEADEAHPDPDSLASPERLDLAEAGIGTVIWATGVTGDFGYLPDDAIADDGQPLHDQGVSPIDGIHFLGLPWLLRRGSGIVNGIASDAAAVADRVAAQVGR